MGTQRNLMAVGLAAALLSGAPVVGVSEAVAQLKVVTSTTDLYDIAKEVGGDKITATHIGEGYQDPHFIEAKPSFVLQLRSADVWAFVGLDLEKVLAAMLSYELQRRLDELAPTHIAVPSGSRIRVDYLGEEGPSLSVRVQELFGLEATPRIGGGVVPVLIKLLSPAQRPVQVTRDLASFWDHGYAQVRKELKGRYPKHAWPDDPLTATPTARTKRKQV